MATLTESEDGRARAAVEDWVLVVFQRGIMIDVGKSHWDLFIGQPLGESIRLTYGPHNSIHPRLHPSLSSIVFVSDRDGDYELYTMSLADGTLVQLTDNGWVDTLPAWSPDGQRIAYVSYAQGNADLFLMQADGSGVLQITSAPGDDLYPAWSPDGAQLLWVQSQGAERSLWVMNADGSDQRMLAGPLSLLQRPLWSPDGTLIALSFDATGDGYSDVAIIRPDGTDLQALHWSIHQQNYVVSSWYPSRLGEISINQFEPEVKRLLITVSAQTPNPDNIDLVSADMGLFEFCCQLTSLTIGHQSYGAYPDGRSVDIQPPASRLKPLPPFTRATGFSLNWDAVDYGVSGLGGVIVAYSHNRGPWWRLSNFDGAARPVVDNFPGRIVAFRTQAYDQAGNFEPWLATGETEAETTSYRWQLTGTVTDNRGIARPAYPLAIAPEPLNAPETGFDGHYLAYLQRDDTYTIDVGALFTRTLIADEHLSIYLPPADAVLLDDITLGQPCSRLCVAALADAEQTWEVAGNFTAVLDGTGSLHTAWKVLGGANRIYYQRRTADGNWGPVELVAPFEISPDPHRLAVGDDGTVHLVWSDVGGLHTGFSENKAFYTERTPGVGWSAPHLVGKGDTPHLAAGADGRVHLFFQCREPPCSGDLIYLQRNQQGLWSDPLTVAVQYLDHQRAIHAKPDGAVLVAWTPPPTHTSTVAIRIRNPQGTWQDAPSGFDHPLSSFTSLQFDAAGQLHVLWGQINSFVVHQWRHDFYTTYWAYWDGQGRWSPPVALHQFADPLPKLNHNASGTTYLIGGSVNPSEASGMVRFMASNGHWSALAPVEPLGNNVQLVDYQTDGNGRGHAVVRTPHQLAYLPAQKARTDQQWVARHALTLTAELHRPTLTFFAQLEGGGAGQRSAFHIRVETPAAGDTVTTTTIFSATTDHVRQLGWVDLQPWSGQPITLTFVVDQAAGEPFLRATLDTISVGSWKTPVAAAVTPDQIDAGIAETVRIVGDNFVGPPQVRLGEHRLDVVRLLDANTLEVELPANLPPGRYNLWLINPDGATSVRIGALAIGKELYLPVIAR